MVGVRKDYDKSMIAEIIDKVNASGVNFRKKIELAPAYFESVDYIPSFTLSALGSTLPHLGAGKKGQKWRLKYDI